MVLRPDTAEEGRKTVEVRGVRRRDDVEILRRAREPVGADGQAADQDVIDAGVIEA